MVAGLLELIAAGTSYRNPPPLRSTLRSRLLVPHAAVRRDGASPTWHHRAAARIRAAWALEVTAIGTATFVAVTPDHPAFHRG